MRVDRLSRTPTWLRSYSEKEYYNREREDLRGLAELIIAKQREGPTGTVNLVFLHSQTKFESRAEDVPEENAWTN